MQFVQIKTAEVIRDVGMIPSLAANGFKLPARFLGLLHLEERNRQGKARPEG